MRTKAWFFAIVFISLCKANAWSQVDTNQRDTTFQQGSVMVKGKSASKAKPDGYDPESVSYRAHRATVLASVIPGAGQFYNGQYWKLPIVYGLATYFAYAIYVNEQFYQYYREGLILRRTGNLDRFDQALPQYPFFGGYEVQRLEEDAIRRQREFFRRNRDFNIIMATIAYGLVVADATVFAHLRDFNVSEGLSMHINPYIAPLPTASSFGQTPTGLCVGFRF